MLYVGADLHKKSISVCAVMVENGKRKVAKRKRLWCRDPQAIRKFFEGLGSFQLVVEATASYEWFLLLVEDLAERLVLAHPKKLRVIAESARKTDKVDAEVLATFLALDMIPEAWRPTPRVREHRVLVRRRHYVQGRITAAKCKLRHKLAHYNQDIAELFTRAGQQHLADVAMHAADRFEVEQLQQELKLYQSQLEAVDQQLKEFAQHAPLKEREARAVLDSIPQVGAVTIDVVLSELGEWRRFRGAKNVTAYAGLAPGVRSSADKRHDLHISKEGSRLLRWVLVETAWRLTSCQARWKTMYERLQRKTGSKKKAIVAVARRLVCVMFSLLQAGKPYQMAA
jgi:transposase